MSKFKDNKKLVVYPDTQVMRGLGIEEYIAAKYEDVVIYGAISDNV